MSRFLSVPCQVSKHETCSQRGADGADHCACMCHVGAPKDRFEEFAKANPHIMWRLENLAREAKGRGVKVGIRLLWERLRWDLAMKVDRLEGEWKLNDHYTARYARLLNERPGLEGYFDLRGDAKPAPSRAPEQGALL